MSEYLRPVGWIFLMMFNPSLGIAQELSLCSVCDFTILSYDSYISETCESPLCFYMKSTNFADSSLVLFCLSSLEKLLAPVTLLPQNIGSGNPLKQNVESMTLRC